MDRYIDASEIKRYGDHFTASVKAYSGLNPIVETLITDHTVLVNRWNGLWTTALNSRSSLGQTSKSKRAALESAREKLGKLLSYLKSQEGDFDLARFFPHGVKADIGESTADVQAALQRAIDGFGAYPDIPNAATWSGDLVKIQNELEPAVTSVSTLDTEKRTDSKELTDARVAWFRDYKACQRIMEGLLIKAGREDELSALFLDMQVANKASSTANTNVSEGSGNGDGAGTQTESASAGTPA